MKKIIALSFFIIAVMPMAQAVCIEDMPMNEVMDFYYARREYDKFGSTSINPNYKREPVKSEVIEINGKLHTFLEYDNGTKAVKEGQYWIR